MPSSSLGELPLLPAADRELRARHLLALPAGVGPEEVEVLATSRFPSVRWETGTLPQQRTTSGARGARLAPTPDRLRLSRHTTLTGPYAVGPGDAVGLGLPATTAVVYDVAVPRERGERPYPGGDRDGIKRAFPEGVPVREELRVLEWLVACARRLGGAVRTAEHGIVLVPDLDATIDLTIFSGVWLEPDAALAVMQQVVPRARLAMEAVEWMGPPPAAGRHAATPVDGYIRPPDAGLRRALDEHGLADDRLRRHVHAEADAFDEAALTRPDRLDGYGVQAALGVDGLLMLEVAAEDTLPPLLRDLPWTQDGVVAYRVRWEPPDFEELEMERPSLAHRVARGRTMPKVHALTAAVHQAVGGEIADAAEFLVNPEDL